VPDADRAFAFFRGLLGWDSERHDEQGFTAHYVVNTSVLTVLTDDPQAPPVRLFFPVTDLDAAVRQVEALGGAVDETDGEWARVNDGQGTPLGVWRPTGRYGDHAEGAIPPSGEVGYITLHVPD